MKSQLINISNKNILLEGPEISYSNFFFFKTIFQEKYICPSSKFHIVSFSFLFYLPVFSTFEREL